MPNRILRDSIRTSDSLSRLTAEEERLFYRLLVFADDYGRFDARPEVILGACYPLFLGSVSSTDVSNWLQRLAGAEVGILALYTIDGRPYGAFLQWAKYQRIRNAKSKYPAPPAIDNNCQQLQTNVAGNGNGNGNGNENEVENGVEDDNQPGDESPWQPPEFFKPLTTLWGYKIRDYSETAAKMQTQCQEAGVNPSDAIARFATFYATERVRYGWVDPVSACKRNLGKSIGQILRGVAPSGNHQRPKDNLEKLKELERGASRGRPIETI